MKWLLLILFLTSWSSLLLFLLLTLLSSSIAFSSCHCDITLAFLAEEIISKVLDKHKKYTSAMFINCVLCWYLYVYKHWCGMEDLRKFKVNLQEQILTFHHVGSSTHWTTSGPPTVLERISASYGCSLFQRISILCITLKKNTLLWLLNWLISWLIG